MKVNYYPILSNIDDILKIYIYKIYNNKSYLIEECLLYDGDIKNISSETKFKEIANKINYEVDNLEKKNKIKFDKIIPILEVNNYYSESKKLLSNFKEKHSFTKNDIQKIIDKAVLLEVENPMYVVGGYFTKSIAIDDIVMKNISNISGNKITLNGDIIVIDSDSMYAIERIISFSKYQIDNVFVTSYMYNYINEIDDNDLLIDFRADKTKFLTKNNNKINNLMISYGLGHVFEQTYLKLIDKYDSSEAEAALRFLQNNFTLEFEVFNINITNSITLNDLIEYFDKSMDEYLNVVLEQLKNRKIEIKSIYCINSLYNIDVIVKYLNNKLLEYNIGVFKFKISKYPNIDENKLIINYTVDKIDEIRKISKE